MRNIAYLFLYTEHSLLTISTDIQKKQLPVSVSGGIDPAIVNYLGPPTQVAPATVGAIFHFHCGAFFRLHSCGTGLSDYNPIFYHAFLSLFIPHQ